MSIKDFFCKIFRFRNEIIPQVPSLLTNRDAGNHAAIVFVHGFHGNATSTWASFLTQLLDDSRLNDWDIYSASYKTSLSVDLPIWISDPEIKTCAAGLVTKLKIYPLDRYKAIVLVAHSMGGLVAQRAILDSIELRRRLRHVILFGTPSGGVSKAALGSRLKRQARDMRVGSEFITQLRAGWDREIGEAPGFSFTVVAGESDAFIPATSSLDPFPVSQQAVVPGNHLEIVRPDSTNHLSYALFYKILSGTRRANSTVESARLAIEHKEFEHAIELLLPGLEGLDANAIVLLALALESVGRKDDSMKAIASWYQHRENRSLDSIGVLAGRLKRRWMLSRQQKDFDRALELYSGCLEQAEASEDHEQAYYHAINVAYLHLMAEPGDGPGSAHVESMARRALRHVGVSRESHWSHATAGEARLMLGELEAGAGSYRKARELAKHLRECDSMHMQAVAVAKRVYGEEGTERIDEVFGF